MRHRYEQYMIATSARLSNEGEHCFPPLRISASKFLLVSSVFLGSPDVHLARGHDQEAIG